MVLRVQATGQREAEDNSSLLNSFSSHPQTGSFKEKLQCFFTLYVVEEASQDCLTGNTINSRLSWSFQSFEIMKLMFTWLINIRGLKMKFK